MISSMGISAMSRSSMGRLRSIRAAALRTSARGTSKMAFSGSCSITLPYFSSLSRLTSLRKTRVMVLCWAYFLTNLSRWPS